MATTRVETMLGDTAIAVHPSDGRYKVIMVVMWSRVMVMMWWSRVMVVMWSGVMVVMWWSRVMVMW